MLGYILRSHLTRETVVYFNSRLSVVLFFAVLRDSDVCYATLALRLRASSLSYLSLLSCSENTIRCENFVTCPFLKPSVFIYCVSLEKIIYLFWLIKGVRVMWIDGVFIYVILSFSQVVDK